jgi:hypothetical protein
MPKPKLLEVPQESFWWHAGALIAARVTVCTRYASAELWDLPGEIVWMFESKATVAPRCYVPRVPETKVHSRMAAPMAQMAPLEMRQGSELQKEAAVAELEHQAAVPEVTEVTRLEVSVMAERVAVVVLEAMEGQMHPAAWGRREMAEAERALAGLARLRCQSQSHQGCREYHESAHRLAP